MAYYNQKLGVWLPKEAKEVKLEKPKKPTEKPPPEIIAPHTLPYIHRVDEDGIDWWICIACNLGYNTESVAKRHQTMKHK